MQRPPLRYQPGDNPPKAGKYELVDHFGERLNVAVWCKAGDSLPLVAVAGFDPVWFIQAADAVATPKAA
jgi:hypothetical protein